MGGRIFVGIYSCDAPSIGVIWTNEPSVSSVTMDFGRQMVTAVPVHAGSFACVSNSLFKIYSCVSSQWLSMWLPVCPLSEWSWWKYSILASFCFSVSSIMSTDSSSSWFVLSISSVLSLDSALEAWCLMPAQWTTSKSN